MVGRISIDKESKKKTKSKSIGETSTFKSTEFVADSDDAAPSGAPVQKAQRKTVSFAPKSIGKAPSKTPIAASAQPYEVKKILKKKAKTPSVSEAESESSDGKRGEESGEATTAESTSEEDCSQRHESPTKAPPDAPPSASPQRTSDTKASYNVKPVNGVKRKAEEELSRNETAGGDEIDSNEEEAEEESEEEHDDDGGSSNDESSATSEQSSVAKTTKEDITAQAAQIRTSIVSYKPPAGFEKAKIQTSSVQKTTELFTPAKLEGKQIWHITAPSQLPIDSIMEVSATSLKDGSSILSYKNSDYGLVPQAGKPEEALLLPATRDNRYQSSNTPLSRTLHIRQLIRLPNHLSQAETSTNAANQNHTPVHQQPPGLHMRFQPFGLSSDSDSDSGGVSRAKQPHSILQTEQVVERASPSKKRKQKDDVLKQPAKSLPVERKKPMPTIEANAHIQGSDRSKAEAPIDQRKRSKSSGKSASREMNNVTPDISANHDGDSETGSHHPKTKAMEAPASTKKPKVNGMHTVQDTPTNDTNDSEETPEQRAHRKAEKRRRKALQQQQQQQQSQSQSSTIQESQPLLPAASSSSTKAHKSLSSSKRDSNTATAAKAKATKMPLAEYSARLSSAEARSSKPPSSPPPPPAARDFQRSPVQQQPNEDDDDDGKMSATKRGKRKEEKEKEKEKKRHKRTSRVAVNV